jgi:geranylgeranyl pyrophosphate synthase
MARARAAPRLMPSLAATMVRLAEGQAMEFQMELPEDHPRALGRTLSSWEAVARRKTGALFAACLRAGAAAAEQEDSVVEAAAEYGEHMGVLFQLQDDFLDLVGEKGRQRRGSDLREGKLSFPVLWACEHGAEAEVSPIRALLELPRSARTDAGVADAQRALGTCGALKATADSLVAMSALAREHPLAWVVPGWVDQCLAPVEHALYPDALKA